MLRIIEFLEREFLTALLRSKIVESSKKPVINNREDLRFGEENEMKEILIFTVIVNVTYYDLEEYLKNEMP